MSYNISDLLCPKILDHALLCPKILEIYGRQIGRTINSGYCHNP
jgi:hypothetical protein